MKERSQMPQHYRWALQTDKRAQRIGVARGGVGNGVCEVVKRYKFPIIR